MSYFIRTMAAISLVYALGCKQKEPTRDDYKNIDGGFINNTHFMTDTNNIVYGICAEGTHRMFVAIDTSNFFDTPENLSLLGKPTIMDSAMVDLATRINNMQKELKFRIDSAEYAQREAREQESQEE